MLDGLSLNYYDNYRRNIEKIQEIRKERNRPLRNPMEEEDVEYLAKEPIVKVAGTSTSKTTEEPVDYDKAPRPLKL